MAAEGLAHVRSKVSSSGGSRATARCREAAAGVGMQWTAAGWASGQQPAAGAKAKGGQAVAKPRSGQGWPLPTSVRPRSLAWHGYVATQSGRAW
jgi:hypothetical protein